MKKTVYALVLAVFLMPAVPAVAEIYKYIDADGQKRWTDDLSQVPKDQRPSAQLVAPQEDSAAPAARNPDEAADDRTASPPDDEAAAPVQPQPEALSRAALEREKAELDEQYLQLMEDRKELEALRAGNLDADAREQLNQRIGTYNEKAEAYDQRLNHFNDNVQRYNEKNSAASRTEANQ